MAGQRSRELRRLAGPDLGLEGGPRRDAGRTVRPAPHAGAGLLVLIGADVIRPGIGWLLRCPSAPRNLAAEMARIRDPTAFAELAALCQSGSAGSYGQLAALSKIAVIIAAKGGIVAGITVGDCVQLLEIAVGARTGTDQHASSPFFYQLLRALGRVRPGRAGGDAGVLQPRPADVRAADRPLPHRQRAGP